MGDWLDDHRTIPQKKAPDRPQATGEPAPLLSEAELEASWAEMRKHLDEQIAPTTWPGTTKPICLQVLSKDGVQLAQAAAVKRFRELELPLPGEDLTFLEDFQEELCVQLLWRACRRAWSDEATGERRWDVRYPACPSADELRRSTTVDQQLAMYAEYRDLENLHNPDPDTMPAELLEQLVEAVKKKHETRLRSFGSSTLARFLLSGAVQLVSSPAGSSSSGPSAPASPASAPASEPPPSSES